MNGTYGFTVSGRNDFSFGIFQIVDGIFTGADVGGSAYRGTAGLSATSGEIVLDLEMRVPSGARLVQGIAPQDIAVVKRFKIAAPPAFGGGVPFKAFVPPGEVWIAVQAIPDTYAQYAAGFKMSLAAVPVSWP